MKKSDVVDVTIRVPQEERMVGAVTKIGPSDTAKSGTSDTVGDAGVPMSMGQPSGVDGKVPSDYVPSTQGQAMGASGVGSGKPQPDMGMAKSTDTLQLVTGKAVDWPDTADRSGVSTSTSQGLENSNVTGGGVKFPPAADTSMQPKSVDSWIGPK